MTQHSSLDAGRWASFPVAQQILMVGNEMNRASRLLAPGDTPSRRLAYERVLRLVDLTVEVRKSRSFRRELLRWRDLVAALYIASDPEPAAHAAAFRALLLLDPVAARQIPHVLP